MAEGDIPNYVYKLVLGNEHIGPAMVKLLADFNIHGIEEDKALKLFYSILAHFIYYLDVHPGHYFHLNYVDITRDDNNFLVVKRNNEYAEDTVTPTSFYNKFCGTQALLEELQNNLDLFANSLLGIKDKVAREKYAVDTLIRQRDKLREKYKELNIQIKGSKEQRAEVLKQRKLEAKQLRHDMKINRNRDFSASFELQAREKEKVRYAKLEEELKALWEEGKTDFPF